ncbi:uncharacterized protein [Triticum aestivum]|uniref:uncharacterized protein isoform X2 n=1 Tax=Triticum aestivum TaxID=4565 RepID=UPI001D02A6DC|nr:uncharacterized protein LOC123145205 isoform X2 [Triticum aestivum]
MCILSFSYLKSKANFSRSRSKLPHTRNRTQLFSGFPEDKDQDHSKHPEFEEKSTDATMEGVEVAFRLTVVIWRKIFDDGFFSQTGKVLLGTDCHTYTVGSFAQLATGNVKQ